MSLVAIIKGNIMDKNDFDDIEKMYKRAREWNIQYQLEEEKRDRQVTRSDNGNKYELYDTEDLIITLGKNDINPMDTLSKIVAGKKRSDKIASYKK